MGTFLLQSVVVDNKKKECDFINSYDNDGFVIDRKVINQQETVKVELEFTSNGDTSNFTEGDILVIMNRIAKELKK